MNCLFSIIAPRILSKVLGELLGTTAIYADGSKTEGMVRFGIFLDDKDSYRFRLPAEMCAIQFVCDSIESKPKRAYIILTDSFAS
jgi:hypothetical protein